MARNGRTRIRGILLTTVAAIVLVMAGAIGWQWASGIMVAEVRIQGYQHAELDELASLVDTDSSVALIDVNPDSIAANVEQHPWVDVATVRRFPTGTLSVRITERIPVAIAIDRGEAVAYLDADGRVMPLVRSAVYDVPTISGLARVNHGGIVEEETVRGMLAALAEIPNEVSALIGSLSFQDGEIWAGTLPDAAGESLPVRLGDRDFEHRLKRMHTFWHRAVISQPQKHFDLIDLRFNSQVVTRESERER